MTATATKFNENDWKFEVSSGFDGCRNTVTGQWIYLDQYEKLEEESKSVKDFMGQNIKPGSFIAYPGAGNVKGEYGLILYRVNEVDKEKDSIKVSRLDVNWAQGAGPVSTRQYPSAFLKRPHMFDDSRKGFELMVSVINSTIKNLNTAVVVNPSDKIQTIFNKCIALDHTVFELISIDEISQWICGSMHTTNPFK